MTAFVQSWLSSRAKLNERSFQERKEAYQGLLEAYHRAAVEGTDQASKNFAYWQMRCEIVAPVIVREAIDEIIASNADRKGRSRAHDKLKSSMRRDLGITSE
ncbi:hypothetical protein [Pseudophaeobacter arcticus]|jgi:hypothetical protein|uniref:hypothetical protein n=1 Tax=Pseudophaeobacter arcticus TaxID=385492 RepID=UPI003342BE7A